MLELALVHRELNQHGSAAGAAGVRAHFTVDQMASAAERVFEEVPR